MTKKPADDNDVLNVLQDFMVLVSKQFERMDKRFEQVDKRFEAIEIHLFKQDHEIAAVKDDLSHVKTRADHIYNVLDGHMQRIETIIQENAARDHQQARLERWIFQLADAAGVKLKYEQ